MKRTKCFWTTVITIILSTSFCRGEDLRVVVSNPALQRLFDTAMERSAANLRDYVDGRRVVIFGTGFGSKPNLWVE